MPEIHENKLIAHFSVCILSLTKGGRQLPPPLDLQKRNLGKILWGFVSVTFLFNAVYAVCVICALIFAQNDIYITK